MSHGQWSKYSCGQQSGATEAKSGWGHKIKKAAPETPFSQANLNQYFNHKVMKSMSSFLKIVD